mgnify:CR=1 FL=1
MSKNNSQSHSQNNPSNLSEQLGFRHSESVKTKVTELCSQENLRQGDLIRLIFNEGLKARFGVKIRGNQVVE